MNQQPSKVLYLRQPRNKIPNPFRPGSKKAMCFEIFLRGGTREEMVRAMCETGVVGLTATTWIGIFALYMRGVRAGRESNSDGRPMVLTQGEER
jgi:hypothetical protein